MGTNAPLSIESHTPLLTHARGRPSVSVFRSVVPHAVGLAPPSLPIAPLSIGPIGFGPPIEIEPPDALASIALVLPPLPPVPLALPPVALALPAPLVVDEPPPAPVTAAPLAPLPGLSDAGASPVEPPSPQLTSKQQAMQTLYALDMIEG
jgi:hypothetical protein